MMCEMKKSFLFMVAATMLTACGGQKSPQAEETEYVPQRSDYSFRSDVRTVNEDGEVLWDSIIVYLTDAKGQVQELHSQALPLDTLQWNRDSFGEIMEDDWNFDGIPDLQVGTGPMNGFGNYTYDVWLWNDETHQFEALKCDGEIYSPSIDSDNQRIVSVWRLDDDVEIIRYKWEDGKLVESEREQLSASDLAED